MASRHLEAENRTAPVHSAPPGSGRRGAPPAASPSANNALGHACRVPRGRTYVRPGDLVVRTRPDVLFTVLGSCVSVCLWDAEHRIGGMNHFVFPGRPDPEMRGPRFGTDATNGLLERMRSSGAVLSSTVAKVFGGARISQIGSGRSISEQNALVATELLRERGIHIAASDLGGHRGRKVLFDTQTGDVWMKYLVESRDD